MTEKLDWTNYAEVVAFCDKLNARAQPGYECCVVSIPGVPNFNIIHVENAKKNRNISILYPEILDINKMMC